MKLILLTSVSHYKKHVQAILRNCNIHTYSYQNVVGYKDISSFADSSNWFVGDRFESESIVFFAFANEQQSDKLFNEAELFNKNLESLSRVHISILHIERTN